MEFTISNGTRSKITLQEDATMLALAFLFASRVNFATTGALFFNLNKDFPDCPQPLRNEVIKDIVPKCESSITEEHIQEIFEQIQNLKKRRGKKIPEEIKLLIIEESLYKDFENITQNYFKDFLIAHRIDNLIPFVSDDTSNIITATILKTNNFQNEHIEFFIKYFASTLYHMYELPFFPQAVETIARLRIPTEYGVHLITNEHEIHYLSVPLFLAPEPNVLEQHQIHIFRNNLLEGMEGWHELALSTSKELSTISFAEEHYERISASLCALQECCASMQEIITVHPFTELLKNKERKLQFYQLHLGITSFRNLLSIYRLLGIINEQETLYILEETEQHINLQNCGLFLYLQPYES